jgi:asparagine synthase (glutamine-hydrolysing)
VDDLGFEQAIPPEIEDFGSQMMFLDLVTYLPDDILVKLDRASMGVSLESRVPILDHRVVEFAWQTPVALKIRNRTGKWILREVLRRYVPDELVDRPKAGFGLPLGTWLRGPLKPWVEGLLAPDRIKSEGYLDERLVHDCWTQHMSGERDLEYKLWAVLMFQAWLEAYPC